MKKEEKPVKNQPCKLTEAFVNLHSAGAVALPKLDTDENISVQLHCRLRLQGLEGLLLPSCLTFSVYLFWCKHGRTFFKWPRVFWNTHDDVFITWIQLHDCW